MRSLSIAKGAVVAIGIVNAVGCRTPTQITVEVTTDLECKDTRGVAPFLVKLGL